MFLTFCSVIFNATVVIHCQIDFILIHMCLANNLCMFKLFLFNCFAHVNIIRVNWLIQRRYFFNCANQRRKKKIVLREHCIDSYDEFHLNRCGMIVFTNKHSTEELRKQYKCHFDYGQSLIQCCYRIHQLNKKKKRKTMI